MIWHLYSMSCLETPTSHSSHLAAPVLQSVTSQHLPAAVRRLLGAQGRNLTSKCEVTAPTHQGHYKQGYYIKVYQGCYVTMTLTNHRPFQNRPTLDAKKMHFCSSESRDSRIFGIGALKTIVLRNKTKLFFDLQLVN